MTTNKPEQNITSFAERGLLRSPLLQAILIPALMALVAWFFVFGFWDLIGCTL